MHAGHTIWWVDAQVDRNWWYLLRATCYSICLIWYFFPHKSCMRLQIPWVMWHQSCKIMKNRRSLLLKLSHQIQVLLWYQAHSITRKSYLYPTNIFYTFHVNLYTSSPYQNQWTASWEDVRTQHTLSCHQSCAIAKQEASWSQFLLIQWQD